MTTLSQITNYINSQPEPKRAEILHLHNRILQVLPNCKLWFDAGVNSEGKVVSNPNIGYA